MPNTKVQYFSTQFRYYYKTINNTFTHKHFQVQYFSTLLHCYYQTIHNTLLTDTLKGKHMCTKSSIKE